MKNKSIFFLAVISLISVSLSAVAMEYTTKEKAMMQVQNTSQDDEASSSAMSGADMKAMDTNGDGVISENERKMYQQRMNKKGNTKMKNGSMQGGSMNDGTMKKNDGMGGDGTTKQDGMQQNDTMGQDGMPQNQNMQK